MLIITCTTLIAIINFNESENVDTGEINLVLFRKWFKFWINIFSFRIIGESIFALVSVNNTIVFCKINICLIKSHKCHQYLPYREEC